jgi:V8-like Glu-specific endopeptidase
MSPDPQTFLELIRQAADIPEEARRDEIVTQLCDELIAYVRGLDDTYPERWARAVLETLRRKRYFSPMQAVADALIQSGQDAPSIRRAFAQALLDQGNITNALDTLHLLLAGRDLTSLEDAEVRGLIGRAYKQLYVGGKILSPHRGRQVLTSAVEAYHEAYRTDPERHLWHGINVVALASRARRAGNPVPGVPEPEAIAQDILRAIEEREASGTAASWDYATALEACVALDRREDALRWMAYYVRSADVDAFELASTHRQLVQVWELDVNAEPGASLLSVLRAVLLQRPGGRIELPVDQLRRGSLDSRSGVILEKILGSDGLQTLRWWQMGIERCQAVARIETLSGKPAGTGFLLQGQTLHPSLGETLLLLTNAHVISDDPVVSAALRSVEAVVSLDARRELGGAAEAFRVAELLFSSPPGELDATLARLDRPVGPTTPYPVARGLPRLDGVQRVYVIGHPGGRSVEFSLNDNLLLDHEDPRLHYRAPTEGGSSGSPVFNAEWELIGLHRAGGHIVPRLRGQPGTYSANEGIWIQAIIRQLREDLSRRGRPT